MGTPALLRLVTSVRLENSTASQIWVCSAHVCVGGGGVGGVCYWAAAT